MPTGVNSSSTGSRKSEGLPVFRTRVNSWTTEGRGVIRKDLIDAASKHTKGLQRKPPVPTAAEALAVAVRLPPSSKRNEGGAGSRCGASPPGKGVRRARSPTNRANATERRAKSAQALKSEDDSEVEGVEALAGISRGPGRKHLLRMLRQAVREIDALRQDATSARRERAVWEQRHGELRSAARLEDRCAALENSVRVKSDAVDSEASRANAAEARFGRLVVWAREEEQRRLKSEKKLRSANEVGQSLEQRSKVLEEEARESKQQLEDGRLKLEVALEDLRKRTSENDRLEMQATTMMGQVEALRELADARVMEVNEQREKFARLVQETKAISSEHVNLRKHFSSAQERWRATERSRAKQDERRRMEVEQKSADLHTLRCRIQELEARLSSETARRQGAEEDARRSREMERRSTEEMLEGRTTAVARRIGVDLAQSYPPHLTHQVPANGQSVSAAENARSHSGKNTITTCGRDTAASMMSGGARSSATAEVSCPSDRVGHGYRDIPYYHSTEALHRQGPLPAWQLAVESPAPSIRHFHTPSTAYFSPLPGQAHVSSSPQPPISASSLRESPRRPGEQQSQFPATGGNDATEWPKPSFLLPRPKVRSPVASGSHPVALDHGRVGFEVDLRQEARPRPRPRPAPSEASGSGNDSPTGKEDNGGRLTVRTLGRGGSATREDCESHRESEEHLGEWWAGDFPSPSEHRKPGSKDASPCVKGGAFQQHVISV